MFKLSQQNSANILFPFFLLFPFHASHKAISFLYKDEIAGAKQACRPEAEGLFRGTARETTEAHTTSEEGRIKYSFSTCITLHNYKLGERRKTRAHFDRLAL